MSDTRLDITSKQLAAFIISAQIGIGILSLPSTIVAEVGHDGWISVLFGGILCLILALLIVSLLKKYKNKTIFEINILVYGNILGYALNIFTELYLMFITAITIRIFTETVSIIILRFTPQLVTTIVILIPTIYAMIKGLKLICRFATLLFIAYLILVMTLFLIIKDLRFTYIMPIGKAGLIPIIKNVNLTIYAYLGFELVTLFYPKIKDKENISKKIVIGMLFTIAYYTGIVMISTMFFGEVKLGMLVFPIYNIEQSIAMPVIERLDTVYMLFWLPTMGGAARAYLYATYYSASMLFKIKRQGWLITFIILLEIIASRIPKSFEATYRYSAYSGIMGMIFIVMTIVTFFISHLRKR
ncbi:GerAB/ArcD/ProY family transporter [Clostridium fungisolvens]|uniref:Spore germination protein B2 n=1 Tax=Clostridium fungisolvens TaxID=1604897 RepID=A0A6V8SLP5_9CLOT|nr:endospore germination permease [Clostridium fungisolvens]GFP78164.1 Spore germination protein B2 [Clostridium fungisolvens]